MRQPTHHMGKRYTFQFHGSDGVLLKHLVKESSTMAVAPSLSSSSTFSIRSLRPFPLPSHQPRHASETCHFSMLLRERQTHATQGLGREAHATLGSGCGSTAPRNTVASVVGATARARRVCGVLLAVRSMNAV
jgi:hypothetical protein